MFQNLTMAKAAAITEIEHKIEALQTTHVAASAGAGRGVDSQGFAGRVESGRVFLW